jgi:ATP-dependent DNA ligase
MAETTDSSGCVFLFDLVWSDGHDLTGKSVVRRRERLEQITTSVPGIQVGGYVENHGKALFQLAKEKGLEGIIAKRKSSIYRPGKRSPVANPPKIPERIQWVRPNLVCEVAFAEWTLDGELRRTTFLGRRDDKSPEEVVLEQTQES